MIKNTSIKVGVKIKPFSQLSKSQCIVKGVKQQNTLPSVVLSLGSYDTKKFQVDAIHDANSSKQSMFQDLHIDQMVDKFVGGFNVTVMAYGQTGAGKTYCMEGNQQQTGIIMDSIKRIYQKLKPQSIVNCSYIQLYNQKIYDLLVQDPNVEDLKLRWEIQKDFVVQDLTLHTAKNQKQMQKIFKRGIKNRTVASNRIHDYSSRSHAIFIITLNDRDDQNNIRSRQLNFVDLAGSQRLFDHQGKLSKQSIQINKSLFSLRKVIKILQQSTVQKKQMYVPYRDSKLTCLLKKAFGGNCLTMMIACVDCTYDQKQETILTLSYAISTGKIQNSAHVNIDHQAFENKVLRNQNEKLRKQLQIAWHQLQMFHKRQKMQAQKKSLNQYSHKIIQCISTIRQLIKSNKQLRQQLDEERKIKRQQKIQIQMLMEQRYMLKKFNALNQSPSPRKFQNSLNLTQNTGNFNPNGNSNSPGVNHTSVIMPVIHQKQQVSPHKIIRIRQILGSTGAISPTKMGSQTNHSYRRPNNSVTKRKKYIYHNQVKTQPDHDVLQYRPPKAERKSQKDQL